MADQDVVAPCYEYFRTCLHDLEKKTSGTLKDGTTRQIQWKINEVEEKIHQYFAYEKTKDLVLWKVETILHWLWCF